MDIVATDWLAYHEGAWAPLSQCSIRIDTHALQYGTGCFEGVRAYWNGEHLSVLFLREHMARLHCNACALMMQPPPVAEMTAIIMELLRRNAPRRNAYIRPMVYKKGTSLVPVLHSVPDGFLAYAIPLDDYLPAAGIRCCVSSWTRLPDNTLPTRTKATGGYLNSALAKTEAVINGCDEAIILNQHEQVSEGSAENLFLVRDGRLITPAVTDDILEGITRRAVMALAADLGIPVQERPVARTELYQADEVFLCGTGCQIVHVNAIDHRPVGGGTKGPVTTRIQQAYGDAVMGRDARHADWLTPVA